MTPDVHFMDTSSACYFTATSEGFRPSSLMSSAGELRWLLDSRAAREQNQNMAQVVEAPAYPKNDAVLAIWRVGLVAYRDAARAELPYVDWHRSGVTTMMASFPDLSRAEAGSHMIDAVAWASRNHNEWLTRGVPKREWIWPPTAEGVGLYRHKMR